VIRRTYEAVRDTGLFDAVLVVTDSEEIRAEVERAGGEARMSRTDHESGPTASPRWWKGSRPTSCSTSRGRAVHAS